MNTPTSTASVHNHNPEKVNTDPYGEGWMIKIKIRDTSQLDSLLNADDYKKAIEG